MKYQKKLDKIFVYTDGASRGNPGAAAIAYIIKDEHGNPLKKHGECIGDCTNNTAEYKAIIEGLSACSSFIHKVVTVVSDSQLAIKQLNKIWRINKEHLKKLHAEVKSKESMYQKVTYIHKKRSNSHLKEVDKLANDALDF